MKRLLTVALCLLLAVGCALAEEAATRTGTIQLEGMNEEFVEARYQGAEGYELWYPSEHLVPGEKYGHACFMPAGADEESEIYFLIVPSDADAEDAEGLLSEAVGGFGPDAAIEEMELAKTLNGDLLGRVSVTEGGVVYRYYLVSDRQNMLLITACFPAEAAEGFGARFDRMAQTISFHSLQPDSQYEGDGYAIGYFAQRLAVTKAGENALFTPIDGSDESGVSLLVVKSGVDPEHADSLLGEAVGGYDGEYIITNGLKYTLGNGLTVNWIQAEQDGTIDRYYLIKGDSAVYCLTATFPFADKSDYGALFNAMADSFSLTVQE